MTNQEPPAAVGVRDHDEPTRRMKKPWPPLAGERSVARGLDAPLVRSAGALILSSGVNNGLGFVYWVLAARMLPVAEVGLGSAAIASAMLVATISVAGLGQVSGRFIPAAGPRRRSLAHRIQAAAATLGAIGGALYLAGSPLWAPHIRGLGLLFPLGTAVLTLFWVQDSVLLGLGRAVWVPAISLIFSVAKLALLGVAVFLLHDPNWHAVVWPWWTAMAACAALEAATIERFARQPVPEAAKPVPSGGELVRFALANHAGTLLLGLPPLPYPLLALRLRGPKETAYFYVSWMPVSILLLVGGSVTGAMVAHAAKGDVDVPRLARQAARYAAALVLPGVAFVVVLGRPVLAAFGPEYRHGYPLLVTLAAGAIFSPVISVYTGLMRLERRLAPILGLGGVAALLNLGLVWPLERAFGLAGFGLAFTAGQAAAALFVLRHARSSSRRIRPRGGPDQSPLASEP